MRQSVVQLENFYASQLGLSAQSVVLRRLAKLWPQLQGKSLLGFGYCGPYLESYTSEAKRIVYAMPAGQGAIVRLSKRGVISCLTPETRLPFADASMDNICVAHGVEEAPDLNGLLPELWRIAKPEGRIVIIAANRSGLWARSEKSPFGAGRPFSRSQLRTALESAGFLPTVWSGALYAPPHIFFARPKRAQLFEQFGETVWPNFSGLILVEAVKRLYAEPSAVLPKRVLRPRFGIQPIGNTGTPYRKRN